MKIFLPSSFLKRLPLFLLIFLFSFSISSCGFMSGEGPKTAKTAKVKYPNATTLEWREEFNQIERQFEAKQYPDAKKAYESYSTKYPYHELSDKASFRLGQLAMLDQNFSKAVEIYQTLIQKTPDPSIRSKARVKLGLSQYRLKKYGEALSAFGAIEDKYLDDREKVKMASFAILSSTTLKEELNKQAYYYAILYDEYNGLSELEITQRFGKDATSKTQVETKFKEWLALSIPSEMIDRRLVNYRGKATKPLLEAKLGKKRSAPDNTSKGPEMAVGVILPLSGKYEKYGQNTLKGMECAASTKPPCAGVKNIRLIVKDSGGDPQKAAAFVDELVQQDKVVAILGPLPSAEVESVAQKAKDQGVVLISLAQKKDVPALGDNIFRFSLTPQTQVDALLRYLTEKEKLKVFSVFYPSTNYGQEFLAEFEKTAPRFSAKINGKTSFSPAKADLSAELRQLKLAATEVHPGGKTFEGLFVPDSYLTVEKVAKALTKLQMTGLIGIGTNAWNDASLPSRVGQAFQKSFFVDLFSPTSENPKTKNFVQEFQSAYTYAPSTLEALGYDTVLYLGESLKSKKVSKRSQVKSALLDYRGFQGATGLKGFREDREASVEPLLLKVEGEKVGEVK